MSFKKLNKYILLVFVLLCNNFTYATVDVQKDYVVSPEEFSKRKSEGYDNYEIWTLNSNGNKNYYFYPISNSDQLFKQISNVVAAAIHKSLYPNEVMPSERVPNIKFVIANKITDEDNIQYNQKSLLGSIVEEPGKEFQIFSEPLEKKIDANEVERYFVISIFLGLSPYPNMNIFGFTTNNNRLKRYDYSDAFSRSEESIIPKKCFRNSFFVIDDNIHCNSLSIAKYKQELTNDSNKEKIREIIRSFKSYLLETLSYHEHNIIKSIFERISSFLNL